MSFACSAPVCLALCRRFEEWEKLQASNRLKTFLVKLLIFSWALFCHPKGAQNVFRLQCQYQLQFYLYYRLSALNVWPENAPNLRPWLSPGLLLQRFIVAARCRSSAQHSLSTITLKWSFRLVIIPNPITMIQHNSFNMECSILISYTSFPALFAASPPDVRKVFDLPGVANFVLGLRPTAVAP